MSAFDLYLDGWRARAQASEAARRTRLERGRQVAEALASLLATRFGARRVVLVGSIARGDASRASDIDLAVEGLEGAALFRAGAACEDRSEGFSVDLVPLEDASEAMIEQVARDGIVLHEQRGRT